MPPDGILPPLQGDRGYNPPENEVTTYRTYTLPNIGLPCTISYTNGLVEVEASVTGDLPLGIFAKIGYDTNKKTMSLFSGVIIGGSTAGDMAGNASDVSIRSGIIHAYNIEERRTTSFGTRHSGTFELQGNGVSETHNLDLIQGTTIEKTKKILGRGIKTTEKLD